RFKILWKRLPQTNSTFVTPDSTMAHLPHKAGILTARPPVHRPGPDPVAETLSLFKYFFQGMAS
ncbi:MAG TPA: hypothetical protein PLM00_07865, partial [Spirochaetota bacterium]|nr:hypothetical protein [Spirochaetota bacterium]